MATTLSLAKPPQGRISVTWSVYQAALEACQTPAERQYYLGHSPGMAAAIAHTTRQAIHDAIDRGRLTALYVHRDEDSSLMAILIPPTSLEHYCQTRRQVKTA